MMYLAFTLIGFAGGMVVGLALKVWIDNAEDEEQARREARHRHQMYDWRDELPRDWRVG